MAARQQRVSLDTNILVRFALGDHPRQSARARQLVEGQDCHVSVLALVEMGYVLQSFYRVPLARVVLMARGLMQLPRLEFDNPIRLATALDA
ncbi:MAG: type II toxin-antitoxin system VapC family toxin, partial [Burkholderiales bacterium]